ncbi:MAG: type IV pilus twitching motility protein PilT [Coriobacteriia bacterium]
MTEKTGRDLRRRRGGDPLDDHSLSESRLQIDELLEFVVRMNASDLHLTPGLPPMVRIDGELVPIPEMPILSPAMCSALLDTIMSVEQRQVFDAEWELDLSFGRRGLGRYRVNAFMEKGDPAAAIRRIPDSPPTIEELGLPPILLDLSRLKRGLVLVTGPTGSGKTTTLAAMINQINRERTEHIITIEDPVEFVHAHDRSIVQQREIGRDTTEFSRALRSALREDPDVILIGEMRDLETIAAAVSAAETGHLVFATLHTNSAVQAIDRIIDVFPPAQQTQIRLQLSASLQAVLAQRLVPKVTGGRICVVEVLVASEAVRNLIREGKTHQMDTAMQSGIKDGMIMFDMELADLVRRGEVSREVALGYSNDPRSFGIRVGTGSTYL